MPRSPIDLPRMQNQPRSRAAVGPRTELVPRPGEAAAGRSRASRDDAAIRAGRAGQEIQSERQRGPAQPRLCLRHAGAWRAEARLRRSLFLASARSRRDPRPTSSSTTPRSRPRCCTTRSRIPTPPAPRSTGCSATRSARLVEGLTKLKRLELVSKEAKQAENLRKLLLAIADDVRVLLVKLADRLHNMRTLDASCRRSRAGASPRKRSTSMRRSPAAWACRRCARSWRTWPSASSIPRPTRSSPSGSKRWRRATSGWITEIEQQLARKLADRGIAAEVSGRRKRAYSIWRKMERKAVGFEQLSDIFGFRVVVGDVAECYQALGIVHTTWPVVPGRFKDYISTPKQNDYRSIHTTVIGPGRQRVELQIRTAEMHADRRIRHRRACALQGQRRLADGDAVAGIERLCVAAPHHRAAGRRLQSGGVPRAHQARTVPRPGVLLHAQGQADRAAARRDADRFRLCGAHRRRQHGGRLQDQRQDRPADRPSCRTATRSRS